MSRALTVATRSGDLAIAQTRMVISALKQAHPNLRIEIKEITTSGDRDRRTALWNLKNTGFFTSQVEDALIAREADFAVHSFKDLPTAPREGLAITAVYDRVYVEDCIVAKGKMDSIAQLAPGARIGTSSLRRVAQLRRIKPDLVPVTIRGNVKTRTKLVESGQVDAVILARAGIERLEMQDRISLVFDPHEFLPAAAQGALAIQTRTDDETVNEIITAINDKTARTSAQAERQVMATMRCGCHAPVGVYANIEADEINIQAFISDVSADRFLTFSIGGPVDQSIDLANAVADQLLSSGGAEILEELERQRRDS